MELTTAEKILLILKRKGMTQAVLADKLGKSQSNLTQQLSRDNFTESDLRAIAAALDCDLSIIFTTLDGESV